jgi:transcriptional regulator with XRE-family HTH domain
MHMKIGDNIKGRRKALGLSREKLAELVEKSPMTIYKWETNKTEPTASEIVGLSKALKSPVYTLFGEIMLTKDLLANPDTVLKLLPLLKAKGLVTLEEILIAALGQSASSKQSGAVKKRS